MFHSKFFPTLSYEPDIFTSKLTSAHSEHSPVSQVHLFPLNSMLFKFSSSLTIRQKRCNEMDAAQDQWIWAQELRTQVPCPAVWRNKSIDVSIYLWAFSSCFVVPWSSWEAALLSISHVLSLFLLVKVFVIYCFLCLGYLFFGTLHSSLSIQVSGQISA